MSSIIRVVRMTFAPAKIAEFEALFEEASQTIRSVDGCRSLALLRDLRYPNVMATISEWRDVQALQRYRESTFFAETWDLTKTLFAAPPEASSYVSAGPDTNR